MIVLVVVEQGIVYVEYKEQFADEGLTLDQVFREDWFSIIIMQVAHLDFEAELLWQVMSFDEKVPLLEVVDLAGVLVVNGYLMYQALVVCVIVPLLRKI